MPKVQSTPCREAADIPSSEEVRAPNDPAEEMPWRQGRYSGTGLWRPSVHSDVAF